MKWVIYKDTFMKAYEMSFTHVPLWRVTDNEVQRLLP